MGYLPTRRARCALAICAVVCALAFAGCTAAPQSASDKAMESQEGTSQARSTPVPAPSGGTTHEVIDPGQPGPITKVGFAKAADLKGGVTVSVPKITALVAKARTPGEITGAAVALRVLIRNDSDNPINVDSAIVTLVNSKGTPGQPTTSDPYRAFSGTIAPGKSGEGTYVFLIPKNDRDGLTLSVEYVAGAPIAHFVGNVL